MERARWNMSTDVPWETFGLSNITPNMVHVNKKDAVVE